LRTPANSYSRLAKFLVEALGEWGSMKIKLFILSEDAVFLAGLEAIVARDDMISLIGGAVIGPDGIRCLDHTELKPDVVILGEPLSKKVICEIVSHIESEYRHDESRPKIIVVSQNDSDDVIVAALRVGVNGYFARIASAEDLLHSLRIVANGGAAFSPTIAARFSGYFATMHNLPKLAGISDLTHRELQILELLAGGLGNRQIARRLFLTEKTVRNYVSRIFAKLDVHDRTAAALHARNAGLGGSAKLLVPRSE